VRTAAAANAAAAVLDTAEVARRKGDEGLRLAL
jgi:hypothetical protein